VFYFHNDWQIAIDKWNKNYLFKNLSNPLILIVLYLSKLLHICVIWTWDGLAPTSCGNARKLYYNMIRRRITEIIVTPDPANQATDKTIYFKIQYIENNTNMKKLRQIKYNQYQWIWQILKKIILISLRLFPLFYVGSYYSITFLRYRRKLGQGHLMSTMRGRFWTGSSLSLPG
jgi:hypothetical protein